ncbi:Uncharacterized protein YcnI [Micromonospora phaseoli]|uniref:Uncharacterized protein YcnI n=1 Tax=Micromonospora phaseoli TaxID=1144548 RepID=A0A1H6Z9G2_9ACTN|nr:DUF1775 domain-containing protein [Micromonospora phaseoli]PZW00499.1 uncharacterized protein YcnI [Micromonospora phaseoli]GIJ80940.1 hypothetical protein Xph01_53720 [Micromonospora phaseoli]SEJ46312.1 Uncharacterized protein YcnI [Micromonospora phaseoli]
MSAGRWTRASVVAAATVITYLALGTAPAAAHVEVAGAQPNGDGTATLTFGFDHSCDDSPTTEMVVTLPTGVTATATVTPGGWSAGVAGDRVTFTGAGLETGELGVTVRIVARPGDTLHFPALQRCADGGSYAWIDITADSEHPAPRLVATNAVLAAHPDATGNPTPTAAADRGATLPQALAVLAGFVAAAAAAGAVFARRG